MPIKLKRVIRCVCALILLLLLACVSTLNYIICRVLKQIAIIWLCENKYTFLFVRRKQRNDVDVDVEPHARRAEWLEVNRQNVKNNNNSNIKTDCHYYERMRQKTMRNMKKKKKWYRRRRRDTDVVGCWGTTQGGRKTWYGLRMAALNRMCRFTFSMKMVNFFSLVQASGECARMSVGFVWRG